MISKNKSIDEHYNIFFNLIKKIQTYLIDGDSDSIIKSSEDLMYYIDICFKHELKILKNSPDRLKEVHEFEKEYKKKFYYFIRSIQKKNYRRASTLLYYLKGSFYDNIFLQKLV